MAGNQVDGDIMSVEITRYLQSDVSNHVGRAFPVMARQGDGSGEDVRISRHNLTALEPITAAWFGSKCGVNPRSPGR